MISFRKGNEKYGYMNFISMRICFLWLVFLLLLLHFVRVDRTETRKAIQRDEYIIDILLYKKKMVKNTQTITEYKLITHSYIIQYT